MKTNLLKCWTYFSQDQSDCRNREGYCYPFKSPNSDTTTISGITSTEVFLKHLVHGPQTAILSLTQNPTHNCHGLTCNPQVIHREKQPYTRSLNHTPDPSISHQTVTQPIEQEPSVIELSLMASKKKKAAAVNSNVWLHCPNFFTVKNDKKCVQKFNMVLQYGVRLLHQPPYYNSGLTRIEKFPHTSSPHIAILSPTPNPTHDCHGLTVLYCTHHQLTEKTTLHQIPQSHKVDSLQRSI